MKGISRIDSTHTHSWFVRVYRDGKVHSKSFSDGVYGSKEKALQAAIEYKEEYERNNPPSYENTRLRLKPQRSNKTGVVGVSETYERSSDKQGTKLPCFSVTWVPTPNKPRSKKFHFSKYGGREGAFEAAVAFRKEREQEILKSLNGKNESISKTKKRGNNSKPKEPGPIEQMLVNLKTKPLK